MTPEEAKDALKLWGKIGIGLVIIMFFAFVMDKCESKTSNGGYEWEENDFDMQSIQKP